MCDLVMTCGGWRGSIHVQLVSVAFWPPCSQVGSLLYPSTSLALWPSWVLPLKKKPLHVWTLVRACLFPGVQFSEKSPIPGRNHLGASEAPSLELSPVSHSRLVLTYVHLTTCHCLGLPWVSGAVLCKETVTFLFCCVETRSH
jgi:hypothetical protein